MRLFADAQLAGRSGSSRVPLVSSPGGRVMIATSRSRNLAGLAVRAQLVLADRRRQEGQDPVNPRSVSSSNNVDAHKCGSSASRARQ
jgi:hypothetical protein